MGWGYGSGLSTPGFSFWYPHKTEPQHFELAWTLDLLIQFSLYTRGIRRQMGFPDLLRVTEPVSPTATVATWVSLVPAHHCFCFISLLGSKMFHVLSQHTSHI